MKKFLTVFIGALMLGFFAFPWLMMRAGEILVANQETVESADAVVVLSTGVDYLPRLMQAAALYQEGLALKVVINGNRKTEIHRQLEAQGYTAPHNWYDSSASVLTFLGVNPDDMVFVNAEDVFDTLSEARLVGQELQSIGFRKLIITTSKFHTRRAISIWQYLYPDTFDLQVVAAANDPFETDGWWKHGRQIRQLLGEYGGWLYFWGARLEGDTQ